MRRQPWPNAVLVKGMAARKHNGLVASFLFDETHGTLLVARLNNLHSK